jgi:hypothetical protein
MKTTIIKLAIVGTILAAGTAQMKAQTNLSGLWITNLVMNVSFKATAIVQTGSNTVKTVRLDTKDILTDLAPELGSNVVVNSKSRLVFGLGVEDPAVPGDGFVRIENGGTPIWLDNNFQIRRSNGESGVVENKGDRVRDFDIWRISLVTAAASFEAKGLGSFSRMGASNGRGTISFSGSGTIGGQSALVAGTASFIGKTNEFIRID